MTTHTPFRWRVRKSGGYWYVDGRTLPAGWWPLAVRPTHAQALAHAVAEAHRMSRS